MIKFFSDKTSFDLRNAFFLANASKLAYSPAPRVKRDVVSILGLDKVRFIAKEDTQLFIAQSSESIVVAFRGTQPNKIKDWLTDADCRFLKSPLGEVHQGFYEALQRVWSNIDLTIKTYQDNSQKLWFTGHSLGGALAMLSAAMFLDEPEKVGGLYTFGQPRVGDVSFAKRFDKVLKERVFRFVNNNDIVPRVPPRAMKYADAGQFRYFNIFGQMFSDIKTWQLFLDSIEGFAEKGISRFSELKQLSTIYPLIDGLEDHDMDNYIANIERNFKADKEI